MRCNPADTIIKKFNGLKPVAMAAKVTVHSVMRWRSPKERGGTGGIIPHWHMQALLDAAKAKNIDLQPSDFLPKQDEAA